MFSFQEFVVPAFAVLGVFSIVVVVHELGHFLVCKWLGVRVEKFSIGFGKEIFGWDWKGTRWSVAVLPLGGFVKPAGEDPEESSGAPDEYFAQKWYSRISIALAGPVMNYLLAFLVFFFLLFFWGMEQPSKEPVIGSLVPNFPAQAAGLEPGDRILEINGKPIAQWEEMAKEIHAYPEIPIDIVYKRKTEQQELVSRIALVPKKDPQRGIGLIGISPKIEMARQGLAKSAEFSARQIYFYSALTLKFLGTALKSAVVERKKPDIELAGPIGIGHIIAKVTREGIKSILFLIAILSLSLGLFNLFPIPLLDGGHVFLYFLEGIMGKPLNKNAVRAAHIAGASLLIFIFLFATFQDISRLKTDIFK